MPAKIRIAATAVKAMNFSILGMCFGTGFTLAQWMVSQIKQSDPAVARALDNTMNRFVAEAPDPTLFRRHRVTRCPIAAL